MAATMERLDSSAASWTSSPVRSATSTPAAPAARCSCTAWRRAATCGATSSTLNGERRCVAFDLPLHGRTPAAADQDFSLPGLAGFLAQCADALRVVGHRPGRQRHRRGDLPGVRGADPGRLHTLTLPTARPGQLAAPGAAAAKWLAQAGLSAVHDALADARPEARPQDHVRHRLRGPGEPARGRSPGPGWSLMFGTAEAAAAEPADPAGRCAPATCADRAGAAAAAGPDADRLGYRRPVLQRQMGVLAAGHDSGATEVVELAGARLFFPDQRAGELAARCAGTGPHIPDPGYRSEVASSYGSGPGAASDRVPAGTGRARPPTGCGRSAGPPRWWRTCPPASWPQRAGSGHAAAAARHRPGDRRGRSSRRRGRAGTGYLTRLLADAEQPSATAMRAALRGDCHAHSDWSDGGSPPHRDGRRGHRARP